MIPELAAIATIILAGIAEVLHLGRVKRLSSDAGLRLGQEARGVGAGRAGDAPR